MEDQVRNAFADQATWCDRLGSPFTARLMVVLGAALDRDTRTGRAVLDWTGRPDALGDSVPLRLAGALHALVRAGRDAGLAAVYPPHPLPDVAALDAAVRAAIRAHDDAIVGWLGFFPQTNEVARSGLLYPGLMTIAHRFGLPLSLYEVGASAGLNLFADRFAYDLGGRRCGAAGSAVRLAPAWEGDAPAGDDPVVVGRGGCDLAPVDLGDPAARDRLVAYVWADQTERLARLEAAIEIALDAGPVRLDRGDAAACVEDWLAAPAAPGVVRVLVHSIAFQYFPEPSKRQIAEAMARAGAQATREAPLAWLSFEQADGGGPELRLTFWPEGTSTRLARADAHGRRVVWEGGPA